MACAAGAVLAQAGPVNVPATTDYRDAGGNYVNGVERLLGPGSYLVEYRGRADGSAYEYDAWNYRDGWSNQYFVWTADATYWRGTLNDAGTGWFSFDTAEQALNTAKATFVPVELSLASTQTVRFGVADSFYGDNSAGISLHVLAVPEPAAWMLLLAGLGLVGVRLARRRLP